jgi:hypothetical protein
MLSHEHRAAVELAAEAGGALMELRARSTPGKELGSEGDQLSQRLLMDRLATRFPADRIRSEEADRAERLDSASGRVWIIDPLDGTREYSEGRQDWAVHVALAVDGVARVGGVALPAMGVVLGTEDPPALAAPAAVPRLVVSRSRPPEFVPFVAERLGATTVPMGSAGLRPCRRPVRVGFGRPGGGGGGHRAPRRPAGRFAPPVLAARPLAARSGGLPPGIDRCGDRGAGRGGTPDAVTRGARGCAG